MRRIVILDADPTGPACHAPGNAEAGDFRAWMYREFADDSEILVPAIVDYEIRRELIREGLRDAVGRFDALYARGTIGLLSITDAAIRMAAQLWANARLRGGPTAHDRALDGDVILAAQAIEYCKDADDWQVITENVDHLARYVGDRARSRRATVGEWMSSPGSIVP